MSRSLANIKTDSVFAAALLDSVEGITQISAAYGADNGLTHPSGLTGYTWATGTGTGQADRVWVSKGRTLAAAATEDIDLYDFGGHDIGKGVGLDAQGLSLALAEIAFISIRVTAASAGGKLRIGGKNTGAAWNSGFGGSDSATSHDVGVGGRWELLAWNDGDLPVADTTNHLLKLLGVTATVTFDVVILGRSA